jgi:hypothetical protein
MDWRAILYFSSILLTCILTGFLAWYAWRQPPLPGVRAFAGMALSDCLLALAEILSMTSGTQAQAQLWFNARFLFNAAIPIFFFIFALEYYGHKDWLSKPLRVTAFIIPVLSQIILWNNNLGSLWVRQDVGFRRDGLFWIADTTVRIPSLWFMVHSFYALLMMLAGIGVVLVSVWRKRQASRQGMLLAVGSLVALISGVIPVFNLLPQSEFNPLIPGIGIGTLLYALAIFRFQFLKHSPTPEISPRMTRLDAQEKQSLAVFILLFVLFTSGIAAASYLDYENYKRQFRAQLEGQLSAIAELKANKLENWRKERLADAETIHNNPAFVELARRLQENPGDLQAREQLLAWLNILRASHQYDRVFLLDAAGVEQISSPATLGVAPDSLVEQSTAASMTSDQIIFLDFHRHSDEGNIHLAMMVPIHDMQNNKQMMGVLVIWIDPQTYLYPLIQSWPLPSESAETLLVRRDGEDVLFLNSLRFQADAALNLRASLEEKMPSDSL